VIENLKTPDAKADLAVYNNGTRKHLVVAIEDKPAKATSSNNMVSTMDQMMSVHPQAIAEPVAAAQANMQSSVIEETRKSPFLYEMTPSQCHADRQESIYFVIVCGCTFQFYRATFTRRTLVDIAVKNSTPEVISTVQRLSLPFGGTNEISSFDLNERTERDALFTALHNLKTFLRD